MTKKIVKRYKLKKEIKEDIKAITISIGLVLLCFGSMVIIGIIEKIPM